MATDNKNHFIYKRIFPETSSLINRNYKNVQDIYNDAIFVLDTNALLLPYNAGKEDMEQITKTYESLIRKQRLFIPEHVIREFVKNRSFKISDLFSNIDVQISQVPSIKSFEYPILSELEAYRKIKTLKSDISKKIKEYIETLNELKTGITNWNWLDPVTEIYQEIFTNDIIITILQEEDELIKEYNLRIENNIPPGNKDQSKDENAIGDFLIWKTILELGKEKQCDIIFVSNDEKNDWLLKGNKKSISTKFELVDEYYRYTGGFNFLSVTFNKFLEIQGLDLELLPDLTPYFNANEYGNNDLTIDALNEIEYLLHNYLSEVDNNQNKTSTIPQEINKYIEIFENNHRKDFNSDWNSLFDYFFRFSSILEEIKSLNQEIIYQEVRMKKDTRTDQVKMQALSSEFLKLYIQFQDLYGIL